MATVSRPPAQTLIQLVAVPTCTALVTEWLANPIPNSPAQFIPQAHNVPFFFSAKLLYEAAATCFQSFPGIEGTGLFWDPAPVPSPN